MGSYLLSTQESNNHCLNVAQRDYALSVISYLMEIIQSEVLNLKFVLSESHCQTYTHHLDQIEKDLYKLLSQWQMLTYNTDIL